MGAEPTKKLQNFRPPPPPSREGEGLATGSMRHLRPREEAPENPNSAGSGELPGESQVHAGRVTPPSSVGQTLLCSGPPSPSMWPFIGSLHHILYDTVNLETSFLEICEPP